MQISYAQAYEKYYFMQQQEDVKKQTKFHKAIDMYKDNESKGKTGFDRLNLCRQALDSLDRKGWERSFHQVPLYISILIVYL